VECLLPGDTAFFRYPKMFEAFQRQALPEIEARKRSDSSRSLRVWSAGCSTGEEAYSIGISACEALQLGGGWSIHIVASDIRRAALATAERGLYEGTAIDTVPRNLIGAYFSRVGDHFLIKPRLRNLVTFTRMNLVAPAFIGKFDCIFCLDLLPHLSASHRSALVQRLHLYLEPGGYLFLGENEKLPAAPVKFITHSTAQCTYFQRPMAAAAKAGK
jgi:chemotaxis methyl-accepting protein methylase